jgi:hypothetical protein
MVIVNLKKNRGTKILRPSKTHPGRIQTDDVPLLRCMRCHQALPLWLPRNCLKDNLLMKKFLLSTSNASLPRAYFLGSCDLHVST